MANLNLKIYNRNFGRDWVDNLSSTSQISSDPASVNYGVIPSTGNATLRDNQNYIRTNIEIGQIPSSNAPTAISINGNQIQEHITSDSDYNIIDKKLDLQFSDRLSLLDKVTYVGMPLRDYSMTAYEMLDDVIGSYGGYCKEKPINWVKYQNASAIRVASKSDSIVVNTGSGWEIIGTPIKVTKNHRYTISYSITTDKEYTTTQGNGIPIQILKDVPTNSDCTSLAIASAFLSKTAKSNTGTITFTPSTDVVYLVLNFGWASDGQTDLSVTIKYIMVDGKALSSALDSPCWGGVSATTLGDALQEKTIASPYLSPASYRETIEKFCVLGQMSLALNEQGYITFYDARPQVKKGDITDALTISNRYKISNLNRALFVKNKVDGVDIKQNKPSSSVDYNTLCYTKNIEQIRDYLTNSYNNNSENSVTNVDGNRPRTKVISEGYYTTFDVKIPKRSDFGLKDIQEILSGKDRNGKPYISYNVTWAYNDIRTSAKSFDGEIEIKNMPYPENVETGNIIEASSSSAVHIVVNGLNTKVEAGGYPMVYVETNLEDKSTIVDKNLFTLVNNEYYSATVTILVGKRCYYLSEEKDWTDNTSSYSGYGYSWIPKAASVSFYGNVYEVSFEEVDCSSANIESATNPVSVPTNELMQNLSDVESIRDNILDDYKNGVPTATIDLFCGLGDWKNGEIIQPNRLLQFEDEDGYWRVTGRTFKYKGAPTLSLELQQQQTTWAQLNAPSNVVTQWVSAGDNKYKCTLHITSANVVGVWANWRIHAIPKTGTSLINAGQSRTIDIITVDSEQYQQYKNALDGSVYFDSTGYINSPTVYFN